MIPLLYLIMLTCNRNKSKIGGEISKCMGSVLVTLKGELLDPEMGCFYCLEV